FIESIIKTSRTFWIKLFIYNYCMK
ncbi:hypothetical protein A5875_001625, partial [Enterococcus sp. 3H8_DIV0648]